MRYLRFLPFLLLVFVLLAIPASTSAQIAVGLTVRVGPPALPIYTQPVCPGEGYLWTPGYWGWADDDFFWVPGTWVQPPMVGVLWTPGYWGWGGGLYAWHAGYWGPHIGFYGGINYGFGYGGVGFVGGMWVGGAFRYNTAVTNVNVNVVHNTYVNRTVIVNNSSHTSFNGGTGGVTAQPTPAEKQAENERHTPATSAQTQHEQAAGANKSQFYSANHGQPSVAGTSKAGDFSGAHSGSTTRPMNAGGTRTGTGAGTGTGTSHTPSNPPPHNAVNNTGKTGTNEGGANKGGTTGGNTSKTKQAKTPPKNPPKGADDKAKRGGGQ